MPVLGSRTMGNTYHRAAIAVRKVTKHRAAMRAAMLGARSSQHAPIVALAHSEATRQASRRRLMPGRREASMDGSVRGREVRAQRVAARARHPPTCALQESVICYWPTKYGVAIPVRGQTTLLWAAVNL
ncbi:hypothetical protein EON66_01275 [archaeon]|nr:MAG: hypothetical protein EON66_01275 [archaeon]